MEREDLPSPALRTMIDEVRADEREVDWARVEARLFDERGEVRGATPQRSGRTALIAGALAIAAAFAIAAVSPTRAVDSNAPVAVTRPPLMLEGNKILTPGERVLGAAWLKSAGRISIRLEPDAIATVVDVGERVHLSLESGAVTADVVPVAGGEPFAVDVAGKRVAVHGTRLRVALVNGNVEVAVSEGAAVVGAPRGMGRTEGTIVPAGSVGTFGAVASVVANKQLATSLVEEVLHAKSTAPVSTVAIAPPSPVTTLPVIVTAAPIAHAPKAHPPAAAPTIAATKPDPVVPPKVGLSADQLAGPLSVFAAKIGHCAPSVFENTLTLTIAPDGKAELVGEDPGLDSPMRACVRGELSRISFPTAEAPTTVKRYVKFTGK